ncbi:NADH dehydrogenase [ubiquinone] 1 alpha subcomplex subunit 5 [Adelges cooleyi]|uniref:NADH dehydrogenase [ubiquinone] 1 alpha subcomplex subunit 5 n=1 Tax=Adelges cooleyi TaxID=133065 RepID=UPI00217F8002|nr:NADH dehydrogenase [ubiquinone] 1 alpha subcomplex subunit 5 [Adelges cooleyi]
MSYKYLKKTTGLTGLNVARNPQYTLNVLYGKILRIIRKMPEDASYRNYTEKIVTDRAKIVQESKTVEEIEKKINCGQAEELIVQAENELVLSRKMLAFKPWEPIIARPSLEQWVWPPAGK